MHHPLEMAFLEILSTASEGGGLRVALHSFGWYYALDLHSPLIDPPEEGFGHLDGCANYFWRPIPLERERDKHKIDKWREEIERVTVWKRFGQFLKGLGMEK